MTIKVEEFTMKDVLWVKWSREDIRVCAPRGAGMTQEVPTVSPTVLYTFGNCAWHNSDDAPVYRLASIIHYIDNLVIYNFDRYERVIYGETLARIDKIIEVETKLMPVSETIYSLYENDEQKDIYTISVNITDLVDITEVTKRFAVGVTANIHWNTGIRNGQITSVFVDNGELTIEFENISKGDYLTLDIRQFIRKV